MKRIHELLCKWGIHQWRLVEAAYEHSEHDRIFAECRPESDFGQATIVFGRGDQLVNKKCAICKKLDSSLDEYRKKEYAKYRKEK